MTLEDDRAVLRNTSSSVTSRSSLSASRQLGISLTIAEEQYDRQGFSCTKEGTDSRVTPMLGEQHTLPRWRNKLSCQQEQQSRWRTPVDEEDKQEGDDHVNAGQGQHAPAQEGLHTGRGKGKGRETLHRDQGGSQEGERAGEAHSRRRTRRRKRRRTSQVLEGQRGDRVHPEWPYRSNLSSRDCNTIIAARNPSLTTGPAPLTPRGSGAVA